MRNLDYPSSQMTSYTSTVICLLRRRARAKRLVWGSGTRLCCALLGVASFLGPAQHFVVRTVYGRRVGIASVVIEDRPRRTTVRIEDGPHRRPSALKTVRIQDHLQPTHIQDRLVDSPH